ncbi:MAG: TIGR03621 family F420-dependent LLM class oxidoreductase [Ktedonobacteraceae bacterium]
MANKAFRFGVVGANAPSRSAWIALAQRIEELGYSSLFVPDALGYPNSSLSALAVAATATTKLRVGSFMFVNDYRHPALLAKEIATLDRLSDGRVELGLGAGNNPFDFQQLGIPFDQAGVRVSRFVEGFSLIKQFFSGETVNFSGKYYTTTELHPVPTPVQQPHPPILIGSQGRRTLTLAAREANIIVLMPPIEEKLAWIREAAGERFEHLEFGQPAVGIEVTEGPPATALAPRGMQVAARRMSTQQAVEHFLEQREHYGISYIQVVEGQLENFLPVLAHLNGK